jgi:hypothetical protein
LTSSPLLLDIQIWVRGAGDCLSVALGEFIMKHC